MKPTVIDPKTTTRAAAFDLWMSAPNPMVTFFKALDVTPLYRLSHRRGLKFNMLLCWCIGKAAGEVKEFYLLPVGRELLQYDSLAVICIILVGSFTAKALGYDIWDAIIVWTKDTFGFETNMNEPEPTPYIKQIPAELAELKNLMIEHGLSDDLIPGYIPDGYKILDLQYTDLADVDSIFCQLSNGSNDILFIYRIYSGDSTSFQLEKDALSPEKYESGGTTYYIMSNMDDYFVTWLSENIECTISGISTHDEALKMITSLNQS